MKRFVFGHDAIVASWVASSMPIPTQFYHYAAIGLERDGLPIAAVVYHNFVPVFKDIEVTCLIADPKAAHPDIIATFLRYPFEQLDCNRVTANTAKKNKRSRKFILGLGFKHEGMKKNGCGNDDMIIYGLTRKDAMKWLERTKK